MDPPVNLIAMGILPLQFRRGESAEVLGLDGSETYAISGLEDLSPDRLPAQVRVAVEHPSSGRTGFDVAVRLDTVRELEYFRHGGITPYVVRKLLTGGNARRYED